jgi:hypothetical protein
MPRSGANLLLLNDTAFPPWVRLFPGSFRGLQAGSHALSLALRQCVFSFQSRLNLIDSQPRQFPHQPHRLHRNRHHLPHQTHNVLRIVLPVRIVSNPRPRIRRNPIRVHHHSSALRFPSRYGWAVTRPQPSKDVVMLSASRRGGWSRNICGCYPGNPAAAANCSVREGGRSLRTPEFGRRQDSLSTSCFSFCFSLSS